MCTLPPPPTPPRAPPRACCCCLPAASLQRLDDQRNRVLQNLHGMCPNLLPMLQWVNENRDSFEGPVVGPVATEISVSANGPLGAAAVQYVENTTFKWLAAFVVTTR